MSRPTVVVTSSSPSSLLSPSSTGMSWTVAGPCGAPGRTCGSVRPALPAAGPSEPCPGASARARRSGRGRPPRAAWRPRRRRGLQAGPPSRAGPRAAARCPGRSGTPGTRPPGPHRSRPRSARTGRTSSGVLAASGSCRGSAPSRGPSSSCPGRRAAGPSGRAWLRRRRGGPGARGADAVLPEVGDTDVAHAPSASTGGPPRRRRCRRPRGPRLFLALIHRAATPSRPARTSPAACRHAPWRR